MSLHKASAPLSQNERLYLQKEFALFREHAFWDHQPVRQIWKKSFVPQKDGPYVKSRDVTKVPKEATELPANFEWCKIDLNNDSEALKLCVFLQQNVQINPNKDP